VDEAQRTRPCGGCFVCAGRIVSDLEDLTCSYPIPIDEHGHDITLEDQLRAEVARLRAGESEQPPAEGVQLTPAEWVHRWNRATADDRLEAAAHIMNASATARRCEVADHAAELEHLRAGRTRASVLHPSPSELVASHAESGMLCPTCLYPAPCPTRRALDGEE
jgi:hypothetical protein